MMILSRNNSHESRQSLNQFFLPDKCGGTRWVADVFSLGRQARRRRVDDAAMRQHRRRGSRTGSFV